MKDYKILTGVWGVSTAAMAVFGETLAMEPMFLLVAISCISGIAAMYRYDRWVQRKAQHELNEKLRRARR